MKIVFSMDGIKNMDQLYTWTVEYVKELGIEMNTEHYHGGDYCKGIIASLDGWKEKDYKGSIYRIGNETFSLLSNNELRYIVAFSISTYQDQEARLEVSISAPDMKEYDQKLEGLKIALKNKLLYDWKICTWLIDEQAAKLCKEAFEQAFIIENKLRAFASKVLIHFLGINWLHRAGLEKEAESVNALNEKFVHRVPEFDNINADFLSMTLETLVGIIFNRTVYKENVVLGRQDFKKAIELCSKSKEPSHIAEFLKKCREADKTIWIDLFLPFIEDPDAFKSAVHDFIEDRNHIAHSKVLSWNAYQVILRDFQTMNKLIEQANMSFEEKESSEELIATWEAEDNQEDLEYEEQYYRERLASETGIDILDKNGIRDWFDEVLHDLYSETYQRYHLDVGYEISDFTVPEKEKIAFSISCPVEDKLIISISAEYSIDDDLGGDSICVIVAKSARQDILIKAEIHYHNGDGFENEEGAMEAEENSEYDTSELDDFKEELFTAIENLNPYPELANAIAYREKGIIQVLADFPCEQCGKLGISLVDELLPVGKCCYCGWENELKKCKRCGELISTDIIENGLCPSCVSFIEKQ